jgi:hypothetical protein
MYQHSIAALFFILASCSCSQAIKKLDQQSAVGGGDVTTLLSGCGANQIGIGYIVCRMPEGSATNDSIEVHVPPNVTCDDDKACVYFKIYLPGGRPTYEGSILKGNSYASVPWSEIVDKKTFDPGDRGFYGVSVTVNYRGPDGIHMKTYSNGYIFLHVVKKEYIALNDSGGEDEYFVWTWQTKTNQTVKVTTGLRVYVSPVVSSLGNLPAGQK